MVFPNLFDFSSLHARQAAAAASTRAETALYDEAVLDVISRQQSADAMLQAARAVAANTPVQLAAAQQSELQAQARYQAGLASIVEVADARERRPIVIKNARGQATGARPCHDEQAEKPSNSPKNSPEKTPVHS